MSWYAGYSNGRSDQMVKKGQPDCRRDYDKPPFSRLFIVCGKRHSNEDLRDCFQEFGTVEDIRVVKDRNTKESRGIAYIKFSKMSEACLAIERMNGKRILEDDDGPKLKVIMAQPKNAKSNNGDYEDDSSVLTRLFIIIPKHTEENELCDTFKCYGEVEYVQILKDRITGEQKGFGYVKYYRAYDAAKAVEECDRSFKAVIAEPKSAKIKREMKQDDCSIVSGQLDWAYGNINGGLVDHLGSMTPITPFGFESAGCNISNRLRVQCTMSITAEQLARLFGIIPGMELCDLKKNFATGESKGFAIIVYNSIGSATYAKEKLNGFEYPPGYNLSVCFAPDEDENDMGYIPWNTELRNASSSSFISLPVHNNKGSHECAERLFIVCNPQPPPQDILVDIFSKIGDLIDVYMLKNKNFGYAKYASVKAAEKAICLLHGTEVYGSKLKVLTAEPPRTSEGDRKRLRRT